MSALAASVMWITPLFVAWLWRPRRPADPSAWVLLVACCALGIWALWFGLYSHVEPASVVFWKPTVLYWTLALVALGAPLVGWGFPVKIIVGAYFALSNREWRWINRGFAAVCIILGGVNLVVASNVSYRNWVDFKASCLMNLFIIVALRLNFVWLPIIAEVCLQLYRRTRAGYRYLSRLF